MKRIPVLALAAALTCAAVLPCAESFPAASAQETQKLPAVTASGVVNMDKTKDPFGDLDGRLVLLTFFAPWSERCVTAVPHLNKTQDRWGGHGLTVISVAEGTLDQIEPWAEEHGVKFVLAALPTMEYEKLANAMSVPGLPHGVLVSPDGEVLWSGHPQSLKDRGIQPHVKGIRTPPPRLPDALAAQQELFEKGEWAQARESLAAARDGLDKISKRWADGLIAFVDARRASWLTDAAKLADEGRFWDAWKMYVDFATTFAGMEGVDGAGEQAAAIRANKDAEKDLKAGDDIVKAEKLLADGRTRPAQLVLKRVMKQAKGTVHAERAKRLLDAID